MWLYQIALTWVLCQGFSEVVVGAAGLKAHTELENLPKISPVDVGGPLFLAGYWLETSFVCIFHGVDHSMGTCIPP